MSTRVIVIHSGNSEKVFFHDGRYLVSYRLSNPLKFTEPHYARLVWLGGYKNVTIVFADFVERQEVDGEREPYLGCSAAASTPHWVPLSSNFIPATGFLQIRLANGKRIPANQKFTIVVEIGSESWVHGTQS